MASSGVSPSDSSSPPKPHTKRHPARFGHHDAYSENAAVRRQSSFKSNNLSIIVQTQNRGQHPMKISYWGTVKDLKDSFHKLVGTPTMQQRLFYQGRELRNHSTMHDCHIEPGSVVTCLVTAVNQGVGDEIVFGLFGAASLGDHRIDDMLFHCRQGLEQGLAPKLTLEGTGGTYIMRNSRQEPCAVFKPEDEEALAPNNPRGLVGAMGKTGMRAGLYVGEAATREAAAYLLDWHHFTSVPPTVRVELANTPFFTGIKVGSLQQFKKHSDVAGDCGSGLFPIHEVQKIAILDLRMFNVDRNDGNILVRREAHSVKLIPIDHGLCMPSILQVEWDNWCWLGWSQVKKPLTEEARKFVLALDIPKEVALLKASFAFRPECLRVFRISSTFLKLGVEAGLSLFDIATAMCRNDDGENEESALEWLVKSAHTLTVDRLLQRAQAHVQRVEQQMAAGGGDGDTIPRTDSGPLLKRSWSYPLLSKAAMSIEGSKHSDPKQRFASYDKYFFRFFDDVVRQSLKRLAKHS